GRVVGYHFFNPVPLMRVVEVIDGLRTRPEVSDALMTLSEKMGHKAVRAKDMPGFIVNYAGRGMNTEGLRVAQEGVADICISDALMTLSEKMGLKAVRAKDMPGFIVNHAGRGMNTEGLRVAQEGVADFAQIDAIMREQAGFRMGPFELMDLTGLDVSHAVME